MSIVHKALKNISLSIYTNCNNAAQSINTPHLCVNSCLFLHKRAIVSINFEHLYAPHK